MANVLRNTRAPFFQSQKISKSQKLHLHYELLESLPNSGGRLDPHDTAPNRQEVMGIIGISTEAKNPNVDVFQHWASTFGGSRLVYRGVLVGPADQEGPSWIVSCTHLSSTWILEHVIEPMVADILEALEFAVDSTFNSLHSGSSDFQDLPFGTQASQPQDIELQKLWQWKILADFCLLCQWPEKSIEMYQHVTGQAKRSLEAQAWIAGAFEGQAASLVATSAEPHLIVQASLQALTIYTQLGSSNDTLNLMLKLLWWTTTVAGASRRMTLDLLHLGHQICPTPELQAKFIPQAALLCETLGFCRKASLYWHEAGLIFLALRHWSRAQEAFTQALVCCSTSWMSIRGLILEQLVRLAENLELWFDFAKVALKLLTIVRTLDPTSNYELAQVQRVLAQVRPTRKGPFRYPRGFMANPPLNQHPGLPSKELLLPPSILELGIVHPKKPTTSSSLVPTEAQLKYIRPKKAKRSRISRVSSPLPRSRSAEEKQETSVEKKEEDGFEDIMDRQRLMSQTCVGETNEEASAFDWLRMQLEILEMLSHMSRNYRPTNPEVIMELGEFFGFSPPRLRHMSTSVYPATTLTDSVKNSAGLFYYSPFDNPNPNSTQGRPQIALEHERVQIEFQIQSILPVPVVLENVQCLLSTDHTQVTFCPTKSCTVYPVYHEHYPVAENRIQLQFTPHVSPKQIIVKGIQFDLWNLTYRHEFTCESEWIVLAILKPVPQLRLSESSSSSLRCFPSEFLEWKCTLRNISQHPVSGLRLNLERPFQCKLVDHFNDHHMDKVQPEIQCSIQELQLPFQLHDRFDLSFRFHNDFCLTAYQKSNPSLQSFHWSLAYASSPTSDHIRTLESNVPFVFEAGLAIHSCELLEGAYGPCLILVIENHSTTESFIFPNIQHQCISCQRIQRLMCPITCLDDLDPEILYGLFAMDRHQVLVKELNQSLPLTWESVPSCRTGRLVLTTDLVFPKSTRSHIDPLVQHLVQSPLTTVRVQVFQEETQLVDLTQCFTKTGYRLTLSLSLSSGFVQASDTSEVEVALDLVPTAVSANAVLKSGQWTKRWTLETEAHRLEHQVHFVLLDPVEYGFTCRLVSPASRFQPIHMSPSLRLKAHIPTG